MKKKILAIGLCVALALSATACGKDKDTASSGNVGTTTSKVDMTGTEYKSEVELGQYKGYEVGESVVEVDDETIKKINCLFITSGSFSPDTSTCAKEEKTVESFDIVNIDYVGKVDGKEFEGGSAKGYNLGIGTGSFIDGFEEGLKGVKTGETVDLNLKFPDDYQNEDLKGKDVVFTVTVNHVLGISDEFVSANTNEIFYFLHQYFLNGVKCTTKDDYIAAVTDGIRVSNIASVIISSVVSNAKVEFNKTELEEYLTSIKEPIRETADSYGMTFEDLISYYYGVSTEAEFDEYYTNIFNNYLVLIEVAKEAKLEVEEEYYNDVIKSIVDHSDGAYSTVEDYEKEADKQEIVDDLLCGQVYYYLADTIKVVPDDQTTTVSSEKETEQETTSSAK